MTDKKFPYLAYSEQRDEYVLVINHTFEYDINPLAITISLSTGKFQFCYLNLIYKYDNTKNN